MNCKKLQKYVREICSGCSHIQQNKTRVILSCNHEMIFDVTANEGTLQVDYIYVVCVLCMKDDGLDASSLR